MERRVVGLPGSGAKAYFAHLALSGQLLTLEPGTRVNSLVVVAADQEEAEDIADAWQALAPLAGDQPSPAALFGEDERGRLASLELLKQGARLIVCTPESLAQPLPLPQDFGLNGFTEPGRQTLRASLRSSTREMVVRRSAPITTDKSSSLLVSES